MKNYNKKLAAYWVQLTLVVSLFFYLSCFGQWSIKTDLLSLLPTESQNTNIDLAAKTLYNNNNQVLVALSGSQSVEAYHQLVEDLSSIPDITLSQENFPTNQQISRFYQPYKNNVLSHEYRNNLHNTQEISTLMLKQLTQVNNVFVNDTLAFAPTLNLAKVLSDEISGLISIESHQGIPSTIYHQQRYFILPFTLKENALSLKNSGLISQKLLKCFEDITSTYKTKIIYSGVVFHTAESSMQAEYEITTFGLVSLLGVLVLIFLVFKSLYPIFFATLVISISVIYGLTAMMLFFNELHLLTLVFALTLIGIVIDYCFHAFVYGQQTKAKLTKPLVIGFVTTSIGYLCLLSSPLALLSQVATFMVFGLFGALLSVILLFPNISLISGIYPTTKPLIFSSQLQHLIMRVSPYRYVVYCIVIIITASVLVMQPLHFNDDIRLLNSSSKQLIDQESTIADILDLKSSQEVVIIANSWQALLEKQEETIQHLTTHQPDLVIRSINGLLPSIEQQMKNYHALTKAEKQGAFKQGLAMINMVNPSVSYASLTPETILKSPLKPIFSPYIQSFNLNEPSQLHSQNTLNYTVRMNISGAPLSSKNIAWIASQAHVAIFDKAKGITKVLSEYRTAIYYLMIISFFLVLLFLIFNYGFKMGLTSWACICTSAILSLAASQYFLSFINIFNLLGVLLVFALAIDYIVFFQEHGLKNKTLLAIILSAVSSIIVFGILIFSSTPAVKSFGMTVMLGLVFIIFLAPLSSKSDSGITNSWRRNE